MKTVELTTSMGLCSGCGICKEICPQKAIIYTRKDGMYQPVVDQEKCVDCGLCVKVCPGLGAVYPENTDALEAVYGSSMEIYNAWSRDAEIRHVSASGGVVSTMIQVLLQQELYDVAFCVDIYTYDQQLKTRKVETDDLIKGMEKTTLPKSRYLAVSHEETVAYIKKNPEKRVIIVGTSCAIQGIREVLHSLKLNEKQYLLIGLFCDKVFNYNVYKYFEDSFGRGKKLAKLHFKNKESGGWPGNMKLMFQDDSEEYLDKSERGKVKDYFMPERCLYCVDKLNVNADISLGDNYTEQDSSPLGSNTVFIRTEQGANAWAAVSGFLEYQKVERDKVRSAQFLDGRLSNLYFARLKEHQIKKKIGIEIDLNKGIKRMESEWDYERAWNRALSKLQAGAVYLKDSKELERQFKEEQKRMNSKHPKMLAERIYYALKRRLH